MSTELTRSQKIEEAINATLKPYAEVHFTTATCMLLIQQYLEIRKMEQELNAANEKVRDLTLQLQVYQAVSGVTTCRFCGHRADRLFLTCKECINNDHAKTRINPLKETTHEHPGNAESPDHNPQPGPTGS